MNSGSIRVSAHIWLMLAGAMLASVVPRMFHTGVALYPWSVCASSQRFTPCRTRKNSMSFLNFAQRSGVKWSLQFSGWAKISVVPPSTFVRRFMILRSSTRRRSEGSSESATEAHS